MRIKRQGIAISVNYPLLSHQSWIILIIIDLKSKMNSKVNYSLSEWSYTAIDLNRRRYYFNFSWPLVFFQTLAAQMIGAYRSIAPTGNCGEPMVSSVNFSSMCISNPDEKLRGEVISLRLRPRNTKLSFVYLHPRCTLVRNSKKSLAV